MVFSVITVLISLFCSRQTNPLEWSAALIYAGAAMATVLAADILSLFIFWECMAVASTVVIWSTKTLHSERAGMRYILLHLLGGVLLMVGLVGYYMHTGDLSFEHFGTNNVYCWFILAGFLINAGVPPLSAWLADAYPEASFSGMVFLSAFTTKTSIYVLLRGFAGVDILLPIGLMMVFYGMIYALLENDIRRILAYSIVNQLGFMVCGIGIGSTLAINGAVAHAVSCILYQALLLMSAGAVLYVTGRSKCTELGGLVQVMPVTAVCCMIGAMVISSFPLTAGFVSKSLVIQAAADSQLLSVWLLLQAASAGVFLYAGLRLPWFVFFSKKTELQVKDPPINMCVAMSVLALFCIIPGLLPQTLYFLLPYEVDYIPYTAEHVLAQIQILAFTALLFFLVLPWMQGRQGITLDCDWIYRRLLPQLWKQALFWVKGVSEAGGYLLRYTIAQCVDLTNRLPGTGTVSINLLLTLMILGGALLWRLWVR